MPDHRLFRALRAVLFAVVSVLLGAVGHGLSSGVAPPLAGLFTGVPLVVVLTGWLVSRDRPLPVVAAAASAAQLGLHALFTYASGPAGAHAAHAGHASGSMSVTMAVAHVVAGVLTAWWLRRGEAIVWTRFASVLAVVVQLLRVLSGAFVAPPRVAFRAVRRDVASRCDSADFVRHSVVLRGPPRLSLVR